MTTMTKNMTGTRKEWLAAARAARRREGAHAARGPRGVRSSSDGVVTEGVSAHFGASLPGVP
jgi:hypothetical protein